MKNHREIGYWIAGAFVLSICLGFVDKAGFTLGGWLGYLLLSILGVLLIYGSWNSIADLSPSRRIVWIAIGAIFLRLLVGVGMSYALPVGGYPDSEPYQAGYIYKDSFNRDQEAWQFANQDLPLISAFTDPQESDQYGGLLFGSAFIYRTLSSEVQRPFMLILVSAIMGAVAVLHTWSFVQRSINSRAASIAAWIVMLYPEAVLLGASLMREPFLIAAMALALDGFSRIDQQGIRHGYQTTAAGLLLALVISPPYFLILSSVLAGWWVWVKGVFSRKFVLPLVVILGLAGAALAVTLRSWASLEFAPSGSILDLIGWWLNRGAGYQLYVLTQDSGWVQKIFGLVPEWSQLPLATAYGLVQPFLPATLMDATSLPLIRALVSYRALGWFLLLPSLIFGLLSSPRREGWRSLAFYLGVLVWLTVILVSYRDAGRMWDNPRWRTIFLSAQAALAGWSVSSAGLDKSPGLKRIAIVVGFSTLVFIAWEAGRYYQLPRLNLWESLALIGVAVPVYLIGAAWIDRRRVKKNSRA
jgi:hypothetical protein